ncbi:hypothetical protein [Malikia sp.]|uniref:hypothetical protein n=1 Tax=Malikia sp. TaxID=2070706 RepID=UPI0026149BF3|nr:hypothetical protein [Malikia sp.]MDD2728299.1 hypothetical protein [Malikia sp.]
MSKRKKPQLTVVRTYSRIDEMMASPHQPLSAERRRHQLSRMWEGLRAIETAPNPTNDDWRLCSDAVNLMETLLRNGDARPDEHGQVSSNWWRDCAGDWVQIHDSGKLLMDAVAAMAAAGIRKLDGGQIRLDADGTQAVRALLEDYRDLLDVLPARTIIRAHRLTEKRISAIFSGRCRPHDVEIIDLRGAA